MSGLSHIILQPRTTIPKSFFIYSTSLNVTSYFKNIAGNKDLKGHSKTEFGLNLLKKLIYNPEHTYLIGDTTHDAEVAHAMGIKCILVADGHQSKERLLATKMPVVNNLKELPALF